MSEESKRRKDALKWLAIVRRADVDATTAAAYLTGVSDLPAWAVEKACRKIGYSPREEFEDKWPELGTIRALASAEVRADEDRANAERLRITGHEETPASSERLEWLLSAIKREIARRSMR